MLVLTRKTEESLLLGGEIRITVLSVNGDKVRLGIDAPQSVKILRGETVDQARDANRLAAASGMNLAAMFKDAAHALETCLLYTSKKPMPFLHPGRTRPAYPGHWAVPAWRQPCCAVSGKKAIYNRQAEKIPGINFHPVSYTHLDVYKRQPFSSLIFNTMFAGIERAFASLVAA